MKTKQSSKSSLFLIELIIAIFFFIIAATICIQIFVKSYFIGKETISLNHAVLWTQNLSEIFLNQNGDFTSVKKIYQEADCIGKTQLDSETFLLLLFDADWKPTTKFENCSYYILASYSETSEYRYQDIYIANYVDDEFFESNTTPTSYSENVISQQRIKKYIHALA